MWQGGGITVLCMKVWPPRYPLPLYPLPTLMTESTIPVLPSQLAWRTYLAKWKSDRDTPRPTDR